MRTATAVGGLAVFAILFFARALFGQWVLDFGDLTTAFYPHQYLWAEALRSGELPLWNPYVGGGRPWLADSNFSPLYPTMLLNLTLPLPRALAVEYTLHLWAASSFMYLFLRQRELPEGAAVLGGIVFAYSGFMIAHLQHASMIRSLAWVPLMLLGAGCAAHGSWRRAVILLTAALTLGLLGGHLQIVWLGFTFAALFTLYAAGVAGSGGPAHRLRHLLLAMTATVAGAILAVLVAGVVLIPAFELVRESSRAEGLEVAGATAVSIPRRQIVMLMFPGLFGTLRGGDYIGGEYYWEMTGTVGAGGLMLALLAVVGGRQSDRWFLLGAGVLAVILSMGKFTPLFGWLVAHIPIFQYFRVPARFYLWLTLCLAVLAAYGFKAILDPASGREARVRLTWGTIALLTFLIGGLYLAFTGPGVEQVVQEVRRPFIRGREGPVLPPPVLKEIRRTGGGMVLAASLALLVMHRRVNRPVGSTAIGALLLGELFAFGASFYPPGHASMLAPVSPPLALEDGTYRIARAPRTTLPEESRTAVASLAPHEFRAALPPNTGMFDRVADVGLYNPIPLRHVEELSGWMWQDFEEQGGRSALLDLFGARYLYDPRPNPWLSRVQTTGFPLWFNAHAMPRGWLVTQYEVVGNRSEMKCRLRGTCEQAGIRTAFDPARSVLLYEPPEKALELAPREHPGAIVGRSYGLNRIAFDLALAGPAILVLNDAYYPGWRVFVDRRETKVHRANHAFRAVFLSGSAQRVEFVFRPRTLTQGLSLSSLGVLVLTMLLAYRTRRRD